VIDWGDVPTWIQAMGTLFALVAIVAAWKVLGVERRRDAERQAAEERAQAAKVAAWPSVVRSDPADPGSAPAWGAAVRNASDLPIYQVHVEYQPIAPGRSQMAVISEVVPPGEWLLSGRMLYPGGAVYPGGTVTPGQRLRPNEPRPTSQTETSSSPSGSPTPRTEAGTGTGTGC
jgi:hypothetical protein